MKMLASLLRNNTSLPRKFHIMNLLRHLTTALLGCLLIPVSVFAGTPQRMSGYKVLPSIKRGNLEVFPVVGARPHDTSQLLTLDEGVRSGEVTVAEASDERGLVRPGQVIPPRRHAEVNRLVLYNNSSRPLLLLAGEIVTGGKQDRVIGADRIVPPKSGPIDLSVFCVEPGRWVGSTDKFGSMQAQMAQPSVRTPAMAAKDQGAVWDNVGAANRRMAENVGTDAGVMGGVTSYAKVFASAPVREKLATYGGSEQDQSSLIAELRAQGAVGVVVAVNGRVIWADIFASTDLLSKYWPKLYKSYVAEAMTSPHYMQTQNVTEHDAQDFINNFDGVHEVVETEPGVYRRADITGDGYRVFQLTSLLWRAEFDVHITKMRN